MSTSPMHPPLPHPFPNNPAANHFRTFLRRSPTHHRVVLSAAADSPPLRRSGNYKPPLWDFNYIQSLTTNFTEEERYSRRVAELIVRVREVLMHQEMGVVSRLELIDDLQRLGISYRFDEEINHILNSIYVDYVDREERDLYSTALGFRLLREHGFRVSQDVFDCFKNEKGDFPSSLGEDTRGVLQLYEASFLLTQGEKTLELANEFATKILQRKIGHDETVRHALDTPIHWRIRRPNARWFIEVYATRPEMNPIVLQLAKLDFNILQATHQQELKLISGWWKQTGLSEALPFARDRVVECYFWTLGGLYQSQYSHSRIMATKVNVLITIIDDIFDVYGTLEELQLFNSVVQRWDIKAMDLLPNYMQMCFLTLNNLVNEVAYDVLKDQGALIIQHLRNSWRDLFRSYTQEAEWYARRYSPTVDEYMSNAWISISAPVILCHAFFLITNPICEDVVQSLMYQYHPILQCSSIILRLANDLGTSQYEMKRGDVPKSIECYMNENGASREEGEKHVRCMIWKTWKKMNEERVGDSQFSKKFIAVAVDLARMAQYMYQHGDGHGIQNFQIKDRISTLLFQPID